MKRRGKLSTRSLGWAIALSTVSVRASEPLHQEYCSNQNTGWDYSPGIPFINHKLKELRLTLLSSVQYLQLQWRLLH